ncbi:lysophospholipid acyltransferase family protein [Legionella sp. W05-934-2]|uniref:lysophospholipid acyltransferase family protein n=1 Tax=Legionella sp. W05-934-2 TaxID=1198649 RepID=UPI00346348B1
MFNKFETNSTCNLDDNNDSSYWIFYTLIAFLMMAYALMRFAERSNRINYEHRITRIIAGFIQLTMRAFHTNQEPLAIPNNSKALLTLVPHRTGWEAVAVAAHMEGNAPQFLATDGFNKIPGVKGFLSMFKTIPVKANPTKKTEDDTTNVKGQIVATKETANSDVLDSAAKALENNGCVALFPQGNFAYIGKDAPMIYSGAAKLALRTKTPIHVIRLDGFWSLNNPFIPLFVRNNIYYRAFLSGLHMNNVKPIVCHVIDFHLKEDKGGFEKEEDIINEINAQLYAFARHTEELTPRKINKIKEEIANGDHRKIWTNKVDQYKTEKTLKGLKEEQGKLEEQISSTYQLK